MGLVRNLLIFFPTFLLKKLYTNVQESAFASVFWQINDIMTSVSHKVKNRVIYSTECMTEALKD